MILKLTFETSQKVTVNVLLGYKIKHMRLPGAKTQECLHSGYDFPRGIHNPYKTVILLLSVLRRIFIRKNQILMFSNFNDLPSKYNLCSIFFSR